MYGHGRKSSVVGRSNAAAPTAIELLPLPASVKAHVAVIQPYLLRRTRLHLVIFTFAASVLIYVFLLVEKPSAEAQAGANLGKEPLVLWQTAAPPSDGGEQLQHGHHPSLLELEVRDDGPQHPHPPLPRDSVFTDPWPHAPEVHELFKESQSRMSSFQIPKPVWPTLSRRNKKLGLKRGGMVSWENFTRASADYSGPYALVQSDKSVEKQWRKIQKASYEESPEDVKIREARRDWVKKAFLHAWRGYKSKAWGHDEVKPLYGLTNNPFNAWGATIIDSLSTLLVIGLTEEYSLARTHVRQVDFTVILGARSAYGPVDELGSVPVFESIIRYLGGLLSAYDLTDGKDQLMLERAEELADWLIGAFDTRYGIPLGKYHFGARNDGKPAGRQVLAEVGSFSLEYGRLAQITGKQKYYDIVHRATDFLENMAKSQGGLLPNYVDDGRTNRAEGIHSFGAQADSYYEYLIKASLLFRNSTSASRFSQMYRSAMDNAYSSGLINDVSVVPGASNSDMKIFGVLNYNVYFPTLEHLACFAGGMVAVGSTQEEDEAVKERDLETAEGFAKTCFWAYNITETGLAPDTLTFFHPSNTRRFSKHVDPNTSVSYLKVLGNPIGTQKSFPKFQSRPETIESVFYLYRITGDPIWQERGWQMFTQWIKHTTSKYGFAGLTNVNSVRPRKLDEMESYVLAETFKYYYLLFSPPDYLSLDEYVFNTEAHPLRLPLPSGKLPSSYKSAWSESTLDEELAKKYADPYSPSKDYREIGQGTYVQMVLGMKSGK